MKYRLIPATVMAAALAWTATAAVPTAPENNGLIPLTTTGFVNGTNAYSVNNLGPESLSIDIAKNGNAIVAWEDDGSGLDDIESVWTLIGPTGNLITPPTVVSNRSTAGALGTMEVKTNIFLSYWRSDNTSIPGYTGWGPRAKANRFGNGIGMGAMPWEIGLEIPELYNVNEDAGGPPGPANDFVCVQLMNNDGSPLRPGTINGVTNLGIVTFSDASVQPAGAIRLGGWDYLGSGNIVIVGESRQSADWVLTGQSSGNTPVYRIVTPGGIEVKAYSAVSATPDPGGIARNGAAVTANGFAVRWNGPGGANVRLFDNAGNPLTTNLQVALITGHPEAAGGGDNNDHGFAGNGKDAYALSCNYNNGGTNGYWVTVLNADGSVRWSRDVAEDMLMVNLKGSSVAIDTDGQVVVLFAATPDPALNPTIMGRRFDAAGNAVGGTFYVSEVEAPNITTPALPSDNPKVAFRDGKIAASWFSRNYPDPTLNGSPVIAYRFFAPSSIPAAPVEANGVLPIGGTGFVNGTNAYSVNNFNPESLSIDIARNGNSIVSWEDDGSGLDDIESVWTLIGPNGGLITPPTVVSNRSTAGALSTMEVKTNIFLSYWRSDNTSIPGYTGWGPKAKANRFGDGIGMGAMPWEIGLEIPELYAVNEDAGGPPGPANDFVCVQLMNNDGSPLRPGTINGVTNLGIVTFADADVQPAGSIRLGGWDYLGNGNVVIVGESRQAVDRALTGQSAGNVPVYRVVTPGGIQVKAYSAVSATADAGSIARNGVGVTAGGFAVRWAGVNGANVRLFDNVGNPTSTNLQVAVITGHPEAGGGGDGNDHGISGNGKDAYVLSCNYSTGGTNGFWVTVLNADGSVRWSRDVAPELTMVNLGGSAAAIDDAGQVVVLFSATPDPALSTTIMGRRFDPAGNAVGSPFYVSEIESPYYPLPALPSDHPKVAFRDGKIAASWFSRNYADPNLNGKPVISYRLFQSSPPRLGLVKSGGNVTISWPVAFAGYSLESATTLTGTWTPVPGVVNNSVTVSSTGTKFYRLRK